MKGVTGSPRAASCTACARNSSTRRSVQPRASSSERALQAMMSGAAVVSDQGSALANAFVAETEIAFFDRAAPQGVVEVVAGLLEPDRGEAMARGGHERAMATALWRHRAQDLANLLG